MSCLKIISGGQTGVDRAALDAAISQNVKYDGWCPKDRKSEDGIIDSKYRLKETGSSNYQLRTRWNVRDSDASLIIYAGLLEGGTKYTYEYAKQLNKPIMLINLNSNYLLKDTLDWIVENNITVLNIAGPRESKNPGIYFLANSLISDLIKVISK